MRRLLLLVTISCVSCLYAKAQSSCTQTLRAARSTYDQGRLHDLPSLLEGCIKSGFTKQEQVEAYKLLTLAYIYLEEPTKADEAMLNLLKTDNYFEINTTTDPAEFIALYKTFRTKPIYRLGGKIGANASQPNVVEAVEANSGESKYNYQVGFQLHITAEIPLTDRLTLNPALGIQQKTFGYKNTVNFTDTAFTTTASEKQSWISLPVSLQYQFTNSKLNPYISLGVQGDYLLNASIEGERQRKGYQLIESKSFDLDPQRKKFNLSVIAAAGAHIKFGGGFIVTEVQFAYGLSQLNSKESAFNIDNNLVFQYGYADSIYKLNSLSVSAGYVHNIFKPKKLKRKK
jgi:hypothetical protein